MSTLPSSELVRQASTFLTAAGFDATFLVPEYRYTWRTSAGTLANDRADLVAFAERPFTMRSACVAVGEVSSEDDAPRLLEQLSYLSAPLAFIATPAEILLWNIRRDTRPVLIERSTRTHWPEAFRTRLADLSPSALLSAKLGTAQLSFVDIGLWEWAEKITADTLVRLLESLLANSLAALSPSQRSSAQAQRGVVRLVFQLFACRVLEDKGVISQGLGPSDALTEAHRQFSENIDPTILESRTVTTAMVAETHAALKNRFAFASLTTDMLGHAYENALVTPQLRKQQGIYYTPASITNYILKRLPIESIDQDDRLLIDPACGSGSFLLAGFNRLASLLPDGWSAGLRHQYLRSRILGFDIDSFAREVAALSLLLTDLQNRNGWKIREADVTELDVRAVGGRRPTIVAANPPFKEIKEGLGIRRELAAEILQRMIGLLAADGVLGMVVPQSLLASSSGREVRATLLREGDLLEISTFPGGAFYSHADTAVLLFRKKGDRRRFVSSSVTVRELRTQDLSRFEQIGSFTATYTADVEDWRGDPHHRFVISPLRDIWLTLSSRLQPLKAFAQVKIGLQIKKTDTASVSESKRRGDVPFIDRASHLRPFALLADARQPTRWLRYGEHLHRRRDPAIFESKKILVNSTRNPGSPWRLVAARAPAGLYFNTNFHAILPWAADVTFEELLAVLNSPIANAWIDGQSRNRWVAVETLQELPVPSFDPATREILVARVRDIEHLKRGTLERDEFLLGETTEDNPEVVRLQVEIDQIVYDGYGVNKRERGEIEKVMRSGKRPR